MSDYQCIVIGAGNGGLTSAASLAKNGVRTLLLERHNIPGGCATSFCRGRFEFEVALHQLSGMGTKEKPGPLRSALHSVGVLDKIDFVEMENLYRIIVPGQLDITLKADRSELVKTLQARFPEEKQSIADFFELVYNFFSQVIGAFYMRDPEISPEKYPLYFKYALRSSEEVLDEYFKDPLLKLSIATYWCYVGVSPKFLSFSDLCSLIFSYIEFKPFHIKGGSQAMSNAIADNFISNGGDIRFNCGVNKILVKDGAVTGVVTDNGEEISCDYIVSNASSVTTLTELIDSEQVPGKDLDVLSGSTLGPSSFTVFLGMDCTAAELGIDEETNFICSHSDMERAFAEFRSIERDPGMTLLTCYNISDPEFSPPGTCQLVIVDLQYADPWLSMPPSRYYTEKYRYAERLLDLSETVFPGLRGHIEECEVATPLTHMRYLGHPGGSIYGFDQYPKDSSLFVSPTSGIKGLYFAGAWAGSGGFQPTLTSGTAAARAILKKIEK